MYDKITRRAERLVETAEEISATYGIPIVNKRISGYAHRACSRSQRHAGYDALCAYAR